MVTTGSRRERPCEYRDTEFNYDYRLLVPIAISGWNITHQPVGLALKADDRRGRFWKCWLPRGYAVVRDRKLQSALSDWTLQAVPTLP